jgi:hypothetical protein
VAGVDDRRRRAAGIATPLGDPDLLDVHAAADDRLRRRAAAVRGRRLLVVGERAAVADRAQVVREPDPRRVEVEVAQLRVAPVAEAVDDERWDAGERPRRHHDGLARGSQPDGQLALEDVEDVGVAAVDVQVRALAAGAEPRPCRVQRGVVGQDLHPPVGRVADDLAPAGRDDDRLAHGAESMTCPRANPG